MRWASNWSLLAVALLVTEVVSQQMPQCAATCLEIALANSSCAPTDTQCICSASALQGNISDCIVMTCTVKEALTSQNTSNTMCGVEPRDISHITPTVTSVFMSLAILATIAPCVESRHHYGPEDIFAISAMVFAVPMAAVEYPMAKDGYGKDIWTLPFDNITRIIKFTYLLQILYIPALACNKMAFLCLYLRIFPSTGIRRATWVLIGINTLYLLAYVLGTSLNCIPVSYVWTKWHGETEGSCLNFNAFGIANATTNIALDLAVIGLPLHKIAGPLCELVEEDHALVYVWAGILRSVTVVSILQLRVVITYATTTNATYDTVSTSYWSIIECFTGIICVNMPPMRRVYRKVAHLCFGTPQSDKEGYQPSGDTRGPSSGSKRKPPLELSILKTVETTVRRDEDTATDTEELVRKRQQR